MKGYDFAIIGCLQPMGCYIGGSVGHYENSTDIRKIIEATIEVIEEARISGLNSFTIQSYSVMRL